MDEATFVAYGTPRPRGSTRPYKDKRGHARVTDSNKPLLLPWIDTVRAAGAATGFWAEHGVAISLTMEFYLPRPKSLPKRKPTPHVKKPDSDKLTRAVMDALSAHLYADDAQVNHHETRKEYVALEPGEAGDEHRPRVEVTIRRWPH